MRAQIAYKAAFAGDYLVHFIRLGEPSAQRLLAGVCRPILQTSLFGTDFGQHLLVLNGYCSKCPLMLLWFALLGIALSAWLVPLGNHLIARGGNFFSIGVLDSIGGRASRYVKLSRVRIEDVRMRRGDGRLS